MDTVHLQSQDLSEQTQARTRAHHLLVARPERTDGGRPFAWSTDSSLGARESWLALCQLVSFAGLAAFVLAVFALHGIRANLDPSEHTISEYSLGSYGWLMRAAFLALGVSTLATAASLRLSGGRSRGRLVGLLMLAAVAIGLFLDTGFNTDRLGVPETFDGAIHGVGTLVLALALPAAAFLLGSDFVHNSKSRTKGTWLLILGTAQLGAVVLFERSPTTVRGWAERLVAVCAVLTLGLLQNLSRASTRSGPPEASRHHAGNNALPELSTVSIGD
jgi:Protein of unknown function (DUF998)